MVQVHIGIVIYVVLALNMQILIMAKKTSKPKEKAKLDASISRYVRASQSDDSGYSTCITCGVKKPWKTMDCGHFITRGKLSTRYLYDPENGLANIWSQCKRCNGFLGGQQFVYAQRLDSMYGEGTADKILYMSNQHRTFSIQELQEMRKKYDDLFRELHK